MAQRNSRGDALLPPADAAGKDAARQEAENPNARGGFPSLPSDRFEPAIQFVSRTAGPLALIVVVIGLYFLIF
jgi:hypothetical protein